MRMLIGFLIGVGLTYLFGAFVGASFKIMEWHWFWRLVVVFFAVIWGLFGGVCGLALDQEKKCGG